MMKNDLEEKELVVLKQHDDSNFKRIYKVIKVRKDGTLDVEVSAENPVNKHATDGHGKLGIGRVFKRVNSNDFIPFM